MYFFVLLLCCIRVNQQYLSSANARFAESYCNHEMSLLKFFLGQRLAQERRVLGTVVSARSE